MGHVLDWLNSYGSACPLRKTSNMGSVHGPLREEPGTERHWGLLFSCLFSRSQN